MQYLHHMYHTRDLDLTPGQFNRLLHHCKTVGARLPVIAIMEAFGTPKHRSYLNRLLATADELRCCTSIVAVQRTTASLEWCTCITTIKELDLTVYGHGADRLTITGMFNRHRGFTWIHPNGLTATDGRNALLSACDRLARMWADRQTFLQTEAS